jgi:hypothetical protein
VFAVGTGGTIIRYNGSSWSQMTSNTTNHLYGIWGASNSDIYAVGASGTVDRFNGATWGVQSSTTAQSIYSVWGTGTGFVWAGANAGLVRRGVRGAPLSTFGNAVEFASSGGHSPNYLLGYRITVTSRMDLTHLALIIKSAVAGAVQMGLYTESGGEPNTLVAQTASAPLSAAGRYEIPITAGQVQIQPGAYWLMADYSVTTSPGVLTGTGGVYKYISLTFGSALPTTFPAASTGGNQDVNYYVKGFVVP